MNRNKLTKIFLLLCVITVLVCISLYAGRFKIAHFIVSQQLIAAVTVNSLNITELTPRTLRAENASGLITLGSREIEVEITELYLHHNWLSNNPTIVHASSLKIGPIEAPKEDQALMLEESLELDEILKSTLDTLFTTAHNILPLDLNIKSLTLLQTNGTPLISGSLTGQSKAGNTELKFQDTRGALLMVNTDLRDQDYEEIVIKLDAPDGKPLVALEFKSKPGSPHIQLAFLTDITKDRIIPYLEGLPEPFANSHLRLESSLQGEIFKHDLSELEQHNLSAKVELEFNSPDLELLAGLTIELKGGEINLDIVSPVLFSSNQQSNSVTSGSASINSDLESVEFELSGLESTYISQWYGRPVSGSGNATLHGDQIELNGVVSDPELSNAPIDFESTIALDGKSGQINLGLNSPKASEVVSLLQNVPLITLPELKADKGEINLKLQSVWGQNSKVTLSGTVDQLDLITPWGEVLGLDLNFAQSELFPQLEVPPSKLSIATFDPAVPITEGSMTVAVQSSGSNRFVLISDLSASAMGGKISLPKARWNLANIDNQLTLTLEAIDLTEVLALYPQEQVMATGKLSGKVPIHSNRDGVTIKGAELRNLGPGTIKYLGPLSGLGQEQLVTALTALKDYQYSEMRAGLALEQNGDFLISLSLEGYGLELNKTRPVNVNLNIEENLPSLLESIRTVRGVERMISTGLRR